MLFHKLQLQSKPGVTLTGKVINNAETVFFPVTGRSKVVMSNKIFGKISDVRMFSAAHI